MTKTLVKAPSLMCFQRCKLLVCLWVLVISTAYVFHLWCTNAWIPIADCTTFKCLTGTKQKKLFLPQAGIMIPVSVWSSVERRAIFRISTFCPCTSDLAFPKPVSPAVCWFRDVNLRAQWAVMALLLNSSPSVSPTWREDTGQSKQPLNHRFLGSDLCSALAVFVKSCLLPWSLWEVSAKCCCSNTTLDCHPVTSPWPGLQPWCTSTLCWVTAGDSSRLVLLWSKKFSSMLRLEALVGLGVE